MFSHLFWTPRPSKHSSPKLPYIDRYGEIAGDPIFTHFGVGQTLNFSWDEPNLGSCHKKKKKKKKSTSGLVKFVWMSWIVQTLLSVCIRRIGRLKIVFGPNLDHRMVRTKPINWKFYHNVHLVSLERKFITDLIQLIGSTSPKFYFWPTDGSWFVSWKFARPRYSMSRAQLSEGRLALTQG